MQESTSKNHSRRVNVTLLSISPSHTDESRDSERFEMRCRKVPMRGFMSQGWGLLVNQVKRDLGYTVDANSLIVRKTGTKPRC